MSHQLKFGEQLRQNRTTQTTDTTQRPLKANTLVSTDTTQTLDISLTTERVIATAPTSEGGLGTSHLPGDALACRKPTEACGIGSATLACG
jgi:hypothetical protein